MAAAPAKQGMPEALALFGYPAAAEAELEDFRVHTSSVEFGGELRFSFAVHNRGEAPLPLRIEYEIGFVKASGSLSGQALQAVGTQLSARTLGSDAVSCLEADYDAPLLSGRPRHQIAGQRHRAGSGRF